MNILAFQCISSHSLISLKYDEQEHTEQENKKSINALMERLVWQVKKGMYAEQNTHIEFMQKK